jgi:hypothetical protein
MTPLAIVSGSFVFQDFCANFTFSRAVVVVKGGTIWAILLVKDEQVVRGCDQESSQTTAN